MVVCMCVGYEKYNTIRADPALCFLERVGRPDEKAIAAEREEMTLWMGKRHKHVLHSYR